VLFHRLAGPVGIVSISVAREYDELAMTVRQGLDDLTEWLEGPPLNLSFEGDRSLSETLRDAWSEASVYVVSGARSALSVITGLILALALLYFVLRDGQAFWQRILNLFSPASRGSVDRAGRRAWAVLGGYVRGTALIAAIDATLIGLGLWILGVPLVFALTVLIFLGAFIPFVGATISGLVAVLVALADGGVTTALIALGIVIGVQFVEGNFLQPIVQSRTVDLHPAVILLAVAAGGALFGILGAYLAVPITAVVFAIVASLHAEAT
jgi:predicted PurR-regulated permease PerM